MDSIESRITDLVVFTPFIPPVDPDRFAVERPALFGGNG